MSQQSMLRRWMFGILTVAILSSCSEADNGRNPLASALEAPYDYYLTGMQSHRFDAQGTIRYRLESDRYTHFPDDDHADLVVPHLQWLSDRGELWLLDAQNGRLQTDPANETLLLTGMVSLKRTPGAAGALELRTETLLVLPPAEIARTEAPVTVTSDSVNLQSDGMQLDFSTNHLNLLSNVRGTHAP